jgi:transposase
LHAEFSVTARPWALLERVSNVPGKRGRKHADDLRTVVDAMLYIAQTGCQWCYLPAGFEPGLASAAVSSLVAATALGRRR